MCSLQLGPLPTVSNFTAGSVIKNTSFVCFFLGLLQRVEVESWDKFMFG